VREAIGIDIGGTFIKAAAIDGEGRVLRRAKAPTGVEGGARLVEERICAAVDGLRSPATAAAGIGVPGMVRWPEGVVAQSPNIPPWRDYPAAAALGARIGLPVTVDNDANMAALGESWTGGGRGVASFMLVTLGTGIGAGIVLEGRLWHGDTGRAGELGHVVVDPGGAACGCGGRGCVERYASASGMRRLAAEAGLALDVPELLALAGAGDERARAVFAEAGRRLGLALAAWFNLMDVRCVVVGGGALPALEAMEPSLRGALGEAVYGVSPRELAVVEATLGEDAGIIGCARAAFLIEETGPG